MNYRVIDIDPWASENLPTGKRSLEDVLNKLAVQGWALVQILPGKERKFDAGIFLEREDCPR